MRAQATTIGQVIRSKARRNTATRTTVKKGWVWLSTPEADLFGDRGKVADLALI
jgi:hypothetical protein